MLVSPDRLGWTYGGSLATDLQSWCQLLRNIHTHSWAHKHTHTHLHKYTYRHSLVSVVQSSEPSLLPAVRLSQNLLHTSIVGILEPPQFPIIPLGQGQASRMEAGALFVLANAHPQRGRMGREIKAKAASTQRAQSFVQRTVQHGSLPSLTSLSLCLLPRTGMCQLILCVLSGACADSWPGNPFQESQVEFCVKQRSITGRPDWHWDCLLLQSESLFLILVWSRLDFVVSYSGSVESRCCYYSFWFEWRILKSNKL